MRVGQAKTLTIYPSHFGGAGEEDGPIPTGLDMQVVVTLEKPMRGSFKRTRALQGGERSDYISQLLHIPM